jgi:hypothetical protein
MLFHGFLNRGEMAVDTYSRSVSSKIDNGIPSQPNLPSRRSGKRRSGSGRGVPFLVCLSEQTYVRLLAHKTSIKQNTPMSD